MDACSLAKIYPPWVVPTGHSSVSGTQCFFKQSPSSSDPEVFSAISSRFTLEGLLFLISFIHIPKQPWFLSLSSHCFLVFLLLSLLEALMTGPWVTVRACSPTSLLSRRVVLVQGRLGSVWPTLFSAASQAPGAEHDALNRYRNELVTILYKLWGKSSVVFSVAQA